VRQVVREIQKERLASVRLDERDSLVGVALRDGGLLRGTFDDGDSRLVGC